MFRTVLFGVTILATHASALDLPANNAPPAFCLSLNNIQNYTTAPPEFYSRGTPPEAARVSAGVICSQSNATDNSCEIASGGFIELGNAYNITGDLTTSTTNGTIAPTIDWTIYNVTGDYNPYLGTSIGAVERRTLRFSPDASSNDTDAPKPSNNSDLDSTAAAYATFVPLYRCISGEFLDCPAGLGIENGTFLQVCYPETNSNADKVEGASVLSGTTIVELTNVTYAASLTDNPHENLPQGLAFGGAWSGKSGSAFSAVLAALFALAVLWQ